MRLTRKIILMAGLAAIATTGALAQRGGGDTRRVRITYENLTTGQNFAPGVFMSHNGRAPKLFEMGAPASFGLSQLAETGNVGPIAGMAGMMMGHAVGAAKIGLPVMPGGTGVVEIEVSRDHPMVSGAWMLGMTNDGFSGLSGVNAYTMRGPQTMEVMAYDAGSERNSERRRDLIALMGTDRNPENGRVARHAGLRLNADAPAAWQFDPARPVARVTITPLESN